MDLPVPKPIMIGEKNQILLTPSSLCVVCFPKAIPALIICEGNSLCLKCFKAIKDAQEKEIEDDKPIDIFTVSATC